VRKYAGCTTKVHFDCICCGGGRQRQLSKGADIFGEPPNTDYLIAATESAPSKTRPEIPKNRILAID
jgi:hypothetical protein